MDRYNNVQHQLLIKIETYGFWHYCSAFITVLLLIIITHGTFMLPLFFHQLEADETDLFCFL